MEEHRDRSPGSTPTAAGSGRLRSFSRSRPKLVALLLGVAIGFAIGLHVHRWWGAGLYRPSSVIMALALRPRRITGFVIEDPSGAAR